MSKNFFKSTFMFYPRLTLSNVRSTSFSAPCTQCLVFAYCGFTGCAQNGARFIPLFNSHFPNFLKHFMFQSNLNAEKTIRQIISSHSTQLRLRVCHPAVIFKRMYSLKLENCRFTYTFRFKTASNSFIRRFHQSQISGETRNFE